MKIEMVKCYNCGNDIPADAKCCCFCGEIVVGPARRNDLEHGAKRKLVKWIMDADKRARVEYDKVPRSGRYTKPVTIDNVCDPLRTMLIPKVKSIEILNPEKVLRFTFRDGAQIKTICSKEDKFDSELACYIAYAKIINKKFYHNAYTADGVVHLAKALRYERCYEKLATKALKIYVKELKEYNSAHMVEIDGKSPRDIIDGFLNALNKSGV